jgi:hypothetical protein
MRDTTERLVTVSVGTNQLLGHNTERMQKEVLAIHDGQRKTGRSRNSGMAGPPKELPKFSPSSPTDRACHVLSTRPPA